MVNTYFEDIDLYLISELMRAEQSIRAAVAWVTDERILRVLLNKQRNGVQVDLIVNDDQTNKKCDYSELVSAGAVVKMIDKNHSIMHHKFCIIDSYKILSGSYNWTRHATKNDEQFTIMYDCPDEVTRYNNEFDSVFSFSKKNEPVKVCNEYDYAILEIMSNKNKKQVSKRTRTFMISEEADKTLTALSKEYNLSKSVIMEKAVMAMASELKNK